MKYFNQALLVLAVCFAMTAAQAQSWPARPVRLISPYAAGGSNDTSARLIAEQLSRRLGQPVLVENKPGAGTRIANEFVAKSAPDGYTILFGAAPIALGAAYFRQVNYDVARDFIPIVLAIIGPVFLTVNHETPVKNVAEFVTWARAKPNGVNFASPGAGSGPHFVGELFAHVAKFQIQTIHYRGDSPAYIELLAGRNDAAVTAITTALPHVKAGKLRVLGVASDERSPLYPDAPTFREQGYPDVVGGGWFGLLAPAGTPAAVTERLGTEVNAILRDPEMKKRLLDAGLQAAGGSSKDFANFIAKESAKWAVVVRDAKIEKEN